MAGMTIVEKIFARNSGEERVQPGDFAVVDVDLAVMLDMSFLATERRHILKVHASDKIAVIFDHMVPAADKRSAEAHAYGRDFVRRFGIRRFHDVGPEQGISHAVVADRAYALPGTVAPSQELRNCSGHPEPEAVAPAHGEVPAAGGGPAIPRNAAPGAATHHATAWSRRCFRIAPRRSVARRSPVIIVPIVLDPLPDIAVHVVQAPWVRQI